MATADSILKKALLPTRLDTAEIRAQLSAEARRRAFFSATVAKEKYLKYLQDTVSNLARGTWNETKAKEVLQKELDALGFDPERGGFPEDTGLTQPARTGSIRDISGRLRIKLQLETQTRMARSIAQAKEGNTPFALRNFPGWKLVRTFNRMIPRDWVARWAAAGEAVAWEGAAEGEFIALKDSPIWQALGDGAGGFDDTLNNPFPPFAYFSGMGWDSATAEECVAAGLDGIPEQTEADFSPGEKEIAQALKDLGPDFSRDLVAELNAAAGQEIPK